MVTQLGLHGEFIPLERAIWAISRHASVSDSQIEAQVGLDFQEDDPTIVSIHKAAIRLRLSRAQAASDLLQILNRKPERRPEWHELVLGVALRNDSVGRNGLEWLCSVAKTSLPPLPTLVLSSRFNADESAVPVNPAFPWRLQNQIGFNRGELIEALDREGIKHALDEPRSPNQADDPGAEAMHEAGAQIRDIDSSNAGLTTVTAALTNSAQLKELPKRKGGNRSKAEPDIKSAQCQVKDDGGSIYDLEAVWLCLREMAGKRMTRTLRLSEKGILRYDEGGRVYDKDALRKFLARRDPAFKPKKK